MATSKILASKISLHVKRECSLLETRLSNYAEAFRFVKTKYFQETNCFAIREAKFACSRKGDTSTQAKLLYICREFNSRYCYIDYTTIYVNWRESIRERGLKKESCAREESRE